MPTAWRISYKELKLLSVEGKLGDDITLIGFAKYMSDEQKRHHKLVLRNTNYFIQLNPPRRHTEVPMDIEFIKRDGQLLFFSDIKLDEKDQLIYMAERPMDWQKII